MLFQQMLFSVANFFSRNITIFHTFATFLQKQKNMSFFLKKITKCCMVSFRDAVRFLYILKNIFMDSSAVTFLRF